MLYECLANNFNIFHCYSLKNKKNPLHLFSSRFISQNISHKGFDKEKWFFWKLFLKLEKTLCKNSAKIITISDSFKNYLINSIEVDAEKVSVISNWSSVEEKYFKIKRRHGECLQKQG